MPKNLYFVDSIYSPLEENISIVNLLSTEGEQSVMLNLVNDQLTMYNHKGAIREGWYVYYDIEKQGPFGYGNLNHYARERFQEYNRLQEQLAERYIDYYNEVAVVPRAFLEQQTQITSYHINVGHGNCSIILIEAGLSYQVWMVDCSIIDRTNHWRNYSVNLEEALKTIAKRLGKPGDELVHINKFFLTHAHYDHYSGIEFLVNNHYIDRRTVCYVNLYYQMASKAYNDALTSLRNANVLFVEPVVGSSINGIRFLHPECRVCRSKATARSSGVNYRIVTNPVNNSSAVVMFSLGGHSMVFTGDLEREGFVNMSRTGTCSPYLCGADYYVVSHHGSINGHPVIPCMNPRRPIPAVLTCASNGLIKAILMGRNGAYNGVYHPAVTAFWNGAPGGLVLTEAAPRFVELDWGTGAVRCL